MTAEAEVWGELRAALESFWARYGLPDPFTPVPEGYEEP